MRVTLSVLTIIIFLFVPGITLGNSLLYQRDHDETVTEFAGASFDWPDDELAADPSVAEEILREIATITDTNVIRTSMDQDISGRTKITHFILLTHNESCVFNEFRLREGRWFDKDEDHAVVSTLDLDHRIGIPRVPGRFYDLTFAPLHLAFDSLPVAGRYVVETPDKSQGEAFLSLLANRLESLGVMGVSSTSLRTSVVPVQYDRVPNLTRLFVVRGDGAGSRR